MNKIYIVRHGEAEGNINRRFHGHTNSQLTDIGERQASRTGEFLSNCNIDIIFSSDLTRAFNTANEIVKFHPNLTIQTVVELRELNGGKWENVLWDELSTLFYDSYNNFENKFHETVCPEGESTIELYERIVNAFKEIINNNSGKDICIVTHGTAIRTLMCYIKGIPLSDITEIDWYDNASVTIIDYEKNQFEIVEEGFNKHLRGISTFEKQDWWRKEKGND